MQKLLAAYCPQLIIAGTAQSVLAGGLLIKKVQPQLVFLDIEMQDGTGFDLLEQLKPIGFEVIFVTGFDHYAVKAFKYNALDYVLKPVMIDDLIVAVQKATEKISSGSINKRLEEFLLHREYKIPDRIALPSKEGLEFYNINDIISCNAEGAYTRFVLSDGKKVLTTGLLKDFEELLPTGQFCRVHHSHIINVNYIKKYYRGRGGYVELMNGDTVEVSNTKKDDFLTRFGKS
jgi:two-component system, LytTR family, response regulator